MRILKVFSLIRRVWRGHKWARRNRDVLVWMFGIFNQCPDCSFQDGICNEHQKLWEMQQKEMYGES